jgi:hypothetical protein
MSEGSISKKEIPTPEKGIRNNEKEEEEGYHFSNYSPHKVNISVL